MTDLPTKYTDEKDEHKKFLITGEAIEKHFTPLNKHGDFYNQRFGLDVLKNDEGLSRSATVDFIGKGQINEGNVDILYNHILNGNAILIFEEDTRNLDLLLKQIPSIPDTKYEELSIELGQLINEWTKNTEDQKTKIEKQLKIFQNIQEFKKINIILGTPVVKGTDIKKLEDEIIKLKKENDTLKRGIDTLKKNILNTKKTLNNFQENIDKFKKDFIKNIASKPLTTEIQVDTLFKDYNLI
jgi:hypothetical protein